VALPSRTTAPSPGVAGDAERPPVAELSSLIVSRPEVEFAAKLVERYAAAKVPPEVRLGRGQRALQGILVKRPAVRREHVFHGQVEQRTQAFDDLFA
jgi:hypothetical protein